MKRELQIASSAFKNLILMSPQLIGVNFEVTDACNSRCKHCNIWHSKTTKDILTCKEIEKIFSNNHFKDLEKVIITGGEPVLRHDLEEIILLIHKILPNIRVALSTNGLLPQRVIDVIKTAIEHDVLIDVGVSLDGIREKHDSIRGVRGNFEKVDYLLHELALLRKKHEYLGIVVAHTLSNLTVDTFKETMEYAQSLNVGFLYQLYDEAPYYHNIKPNRNQDNYNLIKTIQQLPPSFYNEAMLTFLKRNSLNFQCFAMKTFFSLRCNGDIAPCLRLGDVRVGNVKENSFSEVWHSEAAKKARKLVKNCKGCPNQWAIEWSLNPNFLSFLGLILRVKRKKLLGL